MKLAVNGREAFCHTGNKNSEPGQPALLFIHGAAMDHRVWQLAAGHFSRQGCNVIAVDLPGHGLSQGPPLTDIASMSDWLLALLDALAVPRAILVGHSMGSLVALDGAARYPDRVQALALVGTTVPMPVSTAILSMAGNNDPAAFQILTQLGYSKRYLYGANTGAGAFMQINTLRIFEDSAPGVLHTDLSACSHYQAGLAQASRVSCPALLVLGADDRLTPPDGTGPLRAALAHAEMVVLPATGHTIMAEAHHELVAALHTLLPS
ncbi:alpha/beta fold hydrolase [Seongchinamella sediminis]|uniref:Alpha/beta fold hydrolase n=1 Tax=Seongchinamella sediminis TaxID=2283635 RepID=A0A3L7E4M4_9GAMM|nr:alpha/beta hydrolase [Seongchinamella sediminis]RLQ23870.1 alpha/beta fold hydrolase [Seongchinamella sediminis]